MIDYLLPQPPPLVNVVGVEPHDAQLRRPAAELQHPAADHRQRHDNKAGPRDAALEGQVAQKGDRLQGFAQALRMRGLLLLKGYSVL